MFSSVWNYLENTVMDFGDKTVFSDKTNSLTFRQVYDIANSVGTYIAGISEMQKPIVVMTGRNVYTPACFMGVAGAGCFYAPVDSTMPQKRLNQIMGVIKADYMIADKSTVAVAEALDFDGKIILLEDIINTEYDVELMLDRRSRITHEFPLYVIFTSGSTGVPKGVITSHHSLMCYIDAVCKVLDVTSEDVLGNQSPLDYIAAIRDIYLPMKTGASTVIIPKNEFAMPAQLFDTLNEYKVTTLCWSVAGIELPAKLNAFEESKPEYLRKVCFSGSVMPCKYLKKWQENLPEVLYVNQYGPTEATASCTYYVVEDKVEDDTVLPIGRPYENYKVFLLKEDNTEAQQGELGEICVAGPVLALGYYGDKERTEQSFVQNPLNNSYRELIYKTGDIGKFRADGVLEFHGRKDRQIKHMGHRIELGEIEETAKQIDGITDCCSLYHKEKEQLYLFYTGDAQSKDIVIYFRKNLPAFMAPRKLIQLDAIPQLPNGKTDMQTLKTYFK